MGSSFLRKLTLVKQTGYGTSATDLGSAVNGIIPTGMKGDWHDLTEWQDPGTSEYNGILVPMSRQIKIGDMAEVPFDGDLTFENADYFLSSLWNTKITGNVTGTTGYQRDYLPPAEGLINTPIFGTVLAGDNSTPGSGAGYAMLDSFIPSGEISAARGGFTQVSGTFSGHTLGALTTPQYTNITNIRLAGTSIPAWLWQLKTGTLTGSQTLLSSTLIDWSLKINSGFHHKKFQDGQVSPTTWGQSRPEVTLDVTYEQNATALTEYGYFTAGTPRNMYLSATGAQIGAGPAVRGIRFFVYGFYTSFDKPGDSDGNTTLKASFKAAGYTTVAANGFFAASTTTPAITLYV